MAEVKKVPPLTCPLCASTHVKPGFNRKSKGRYVRDSKIYCYSCMNVTDTKTGKVKKHNYYPLGARNVEEV